MNLKNKILNKSLEIFRKKRELKIGIRYDNFLGLKKAVNILWDLKKFITPNDFEQALEHFLENDEYALIVILKSILEKVVTQKRFLLASKICCALGAFYSCESDQQAIDYYQRALVFNPKNLEASIICGLLYLNEEQYEPAEKLLEKIFAQKPIFKLFNCFQKQNLTALAYSGLANVALHQGNLKEATIKLFMALKFFEKNKMLKEIANSYQKLGVIYRIAGHDELAEEMHRSALKIYLELNWPENIADSYGNLGMTMGVRENLDEALAYHHQSLEINQMLNRELAVASQYENIGITYHMQKQFSSAEQNLQKALALFIKHDLRYAIARNCENLSVLYEKTHNLEQATYANFQALRIYQEINELKGQAECHANLGKLMHKSQKFKQSQKHFNLAIKIEKKLGINNVLSIALNNLGLLYLAQNNLTLAEKTFKEALDLELKTRRVISIGAVYNNLSHLEKLKGNTLKAEEYHQKAQTYFKEIEKK